MRFDCIHCRKATTKPQSVKGAFLRMLTVYKNGTPIDPLKMDAPPSKPVQPAYRDSFILVKQQILAEMDSLHKAHVMLIKNDTSAIDNTNNLKLEK